MSTLLKVAFSTDPTGMSKDLTEEITIPSGVCLFCLHDQRHSIARLHNEVKKALEYKGYEWNESLWYFELLKVYVL